MEYSKILEILHENANRDKIATMKRNGIEGKLVLGVPVRFLRKLSQEIGIGHNLANHLWESGIHEARILASMIDDPGKVTEQQMESWVRGFDSWDLCDLVCMNLFVKTKFAYEKAIQWSYQGPEYIKRAGFILMTSLAAQNILTDNEQYFPFFKRILDEAEDSRNFVKKAIIWSLRQIGKKNQILKKKALETAHEMLENPSKTAKWIAYEVIEGLNPKELLN